MSYQEVFPRGSLEERTRKAFEILKKCTLCPHHCGVNRLGGETGFCRATDQVSVADWGPHFGEEGPLVGTNGSGTIFFSHCTLGCVFCQNYCISREGEGRIIDRENLAEIMLSLQGRGCHNINLVSPTHYVPGILAALELACNQGLTVPLVYNSSGYEEGSTLKILDGIIDIYMPDIKYSDSRVAERLSGVGDYPRVVKEAVKEMHRQVGDLVLDERGVAKRGLVVRHLVLPGGLSGTDQVLEFIAKEVSPNTYLNLMDQYHPAYQAWRHPPLQRGLTRREYEEAVISAKEKGLSRLA